MRGPGGALKLEELPGCGRDAPDRRHVAILDLPVGVRDVEPGHSQDGAAEVENRLLREDRGDLSPNPAVRGASCTTTTRPVFDADPSSASSSSGLSERRSSTSTEASPASSSAARSQTGTIAP